jgi:hypothetical protein
VHKILSAYLGIEAVNMVKQNPYSESFLRTIVKDHGDKIKVPAAGGH